MTILNIYVEVELLYRWKLCRLDSIFMLTIFQNYAVNFYKSYILHPIMDLTKYTIDPHY